MVHSEIASPADAGFESAPSAAFVVQGDDLIVIAANAAMRAGFPRERLLGAPLRDVFPEMAGQGAFELYERALGGEPQEHHEFRFELEQPSRPGQLDEVYVDVSMAPIHDERGVVQGVVCEVRDVTNRVLARAAAERRAARAEAMYADAVGLVRTMQRAMLPDGVPLVPGLRVAATYLLAESEGTAGGDWFDAIHLPGDRWAFIVGDVVGHGVQASTTMGRLRAALRTALCVHDDPARALSVLDRYVATDPRARAATVVVGILDPQSGTFTYCTAGHPPPLLLPADEGEARFLPTTGTGPLGTATAFATHTVSIAEGDSLLLYSDGLVERPKRDVVRAQVELLHVVTEVARHKPWPRDASTSDAENLCRVVLEQLTRETGYDDDVTLLIVQRSRGTAVKLREVDAVDVATAVKFRGVLSRWLTDIGVEYDDSVAVQHAVDELVINVVDHAYGPSDGGDVVELGARLTGDGHVELTVRDYGRWRSADHAAVDEDPGGRGRGLVLARGFVDDLTLVPGASGTTAHIRHRVERKADHRIIGRPAPAVATMRENLVVRRSSTGDIEIGGAVDTGAARELGAALLTASSGGTAPLIIDLTAVTHLSSAGIQALQEFVRVSPGTSLRAPVGTVAQHVLSITHVDHIR